MNKTKLFVGLTIAIIALAAMIKPAFAQSNPCAGIPDGELPAGETSGLFVCMSGQMACNENDPTVQWRGGCREYLKWLQYPDWATFPIYGGTSAPAPAADAPALEPANGGEIIVSAPTPGPELGSARTTYMACTPGEDWQNGLVCGGQGYMCCQSKCDWWDKIPLCSDTGVASVAAQPEASAETASGSTAAEEESFRQEMLKLTGDTPKSIGILGYVVIFMMALIMAAGLYAIGLGVSMSGGGIVAPIGAIFTFTCFMALMVLAGSAIAYHGFGVGDSPAIGWKGVQLVGAAFVAMAFLIGFGFVKKTYSSASGAQVFLLDVPVVIGAIAMAWFWLFPLITSIIF